MIGDGRAGAPGPGVRRSDRALTVRLAALLACAALLAAACGAGAQAAASRKSAADPPTFVTTASWGPASWTYNAHAPASSGFFQGLQYSVLLPLGVAEKTKNRVQMFNIIPELYTSFSEGKHSITVHLQPGAKYSNGEAVNAQNVLDTILLDGVAMNGTFESDVTNATVVNPTTIQIDFLPNVPSIIVRGWMLAVQPLPMSQYGQFLNPTIDQDVWTYNKLLQTPSTSATAESSAAYKALQADYVNLEHYQPKKLIGDGPFMLKGVSTGSALLVKSPTYFGAAKVHVQKMELINTVTSTANVYPLLYSNGVDWYGPASPSAVEYDQWLRTPGAHSESVEQDRTEELLFNNQRYPFTLQAVRQAIAYLINRKTLLESEDGGKVIGNQPEQIPDGLGGVLNPIWLSAAQLKQLNPYKYSPAKATQLLRSAGFKKSGGKWIMPNGQRFTTTVISSSASPPPNGPLFVKQIASVLSSFGIQTTATIIPSASYTTQISKGEFDLAQDEGVNGNLAPVCGLAGSGLGAPINYSHSSNGAFTAGEPGIGFGPDFDIPGLGKVPVSPTIDYQCQHTASGPPAAKLSWDYAQVVNSQLPFLTYSDIESVILYSSTHFSWPAASNYLWQEAGIYTTQALLLMIEQGLVRAK